MIAAEGINDVAVTDFGQPFSRAALGRCLREGIRRDGNCQQERGDKT
jgi:hypothetical protein